MECTIHPTAIVDEPARIGRGTRIWHFCHIMAGAVIGENCNLGQNVFVAAGVRVGNGCKIQNNVSLYEGVTLDDHVFCGPSMVFTNVRNPRSEIVRRGQYEPTHVERGVTFGANCTVVCGSRIGRYAFIAAGAVVTGNVPPFALLAGVPARRVGWAGKAGVRLEPVPGEPNVFRCPETGARYRQIDTQTLTPDEEPGEGAEEPDEAVPLLDLKAQHRTIAGEIDVAIKRVIDSQGFILGPEVQAFEAEAAAAIGAPHAIGCASGSDALLLALMALDLAPGSEVITTPYTFFATVSAIVRLGLKPLLCDIDPNTFLVDPVKIERCITSHTLAIIPVHLFGQCADMQAIMALSEDHGMAVIEDAAQAIGARDNGRPAGTMGAIGCFSFFPSKNLGGFGDGGLLTTGDAELAARLRSLRVHGARDRYYHEWVGINSRLDALQAAVLRVKLPRLEAWGLARAANAGRYATLFGEAGLLQPPCAPPEPGKVILPLERSQQLHVYNQYVIRVAPSLRDPLRDHLTRHKIGNAIYYPLPLHLQPCFRDLGYRPGDFPAAEAAAAESLALPVYPELSATQQRRVVGAIADFMKAHA